MPAAFTLEPLHLRLATEHEYEQLHAIRNSIRLEILPDDPPWTLAEDIARWQSRPALVQDTSWAAWDASHSCILAFGQADIYNTGDNPHVLWFNIDVLPQWRRQRIGSALMQLIADHARRNGRTLLLNECSDRIPAAAAFLTRLGGNKGLEEPVNEVHVADLDRDLIASWLENAVGADSEFVLDFWTGPYPTNRLQDMANLLQVTANDQPRDALQTEDIHYSPELVEQFDAEQRAGGEQRWSAYLVSRRDGRLAGVSEVYWNPNRPAILHQGFTGVLPEFRGRGLGRSLKAAMLERIFRGRPQVQIIRAGNASSNAPMLKINRQLGFKQLVAWSTWQIELNKVEETLAARL